MLDIQEISVGRTHHKNRWTRILPPMKNLFFVSAHILATIITLLRLGGARALVAENLLLKIQLLIINRSRQRDLVLICLSDSPCN